MSDGKRVLLIGLDPAVVDYGKWAGLTPERLEGVLRQDASKMAEHGVEAEICFVDHGETAAETVRKAIADAHYDCVLIGAGVRTDPDEFLLFERLVNVVHQTAPDSRICFNTGPTDSVDAVLRWI